ncbi:hypothetical protein [Kutzneria sp. NPDC052558]|uniref:hypothetical protein n=1 Tax=Kutzneria sp. NPDC052558 TaxID=3364121 RepID=UPI0037CC9F74
MPEVVFADGVLDEHDQDRVRFALNQIDFDGTGAWRHPVGYVKVRKVFGNGRSGSLALHVELSTGQVVLSRVLKVDRIDVMAREWRGWQEISQFNNAFFAPVFAASRDVVDTRRRGPYDCGAVVYGDAAEYNGDASAALQSLEEIARDPARVDETVAVIEQLFRGIAVTLHNAHHVEDQPTSLARLNRRLGPVLEIRSDPGTAEAPMPNKIFRRALTGAADDIAPGRRIRFTLSEHDHVQIRVDGKDARQGQGIVEVSRGLARRELLPEPALSCADLFAALPRVLTETITSRVTSRSHGDLNARNVLVVNGRPYLIDYAEFAADLPQQLDFAWLEVSLLRDVYAARDPAGLIRLQRALAIGSRLLHLGVTAEEVLDACREFVPADNHDALRVLLTIRTQAHRVYPEKARPVWWRDHLAQLLLSAHRTLKWSDDSQSVAKLHAVTAMAAVATEWLTDGDPFEHWDHHVNEAVSLLQRHLRRKLREGMPELARELTVEHYVDLTMDLSDPYSPSIDKLMSSEYHVVVSGPPGSGKTTVLRESGRRLLADESARVPLFAHAQDFQESMIDAEEARLGVRHLILDDASPDQLADLRDRYPTMPILASGDPTAGFGHAQLRGLDEQAIEIYLWRRVPELGVNRLMDTLLTDPAWRRLNIQHPRTLSLLADYLALHGMPDSPVDLHRAMLLAKVDGDEEALRAGEAVAIALLEDVPPGPIHPKLIRSGLIIADDTEVRFAERGDRDHLAALGLRHEESDPDRIHRLAEEIQWRDAVIAFVELPEVSANEVASLANAIPNPIWKAELLASAANCPTETLSAFVADQLARLRTASIVRAAIILTVLKLLRQHAALAQIALDGTISKHARTRALRKLEALTDKARPGQPRHSAAAELIATLESLLNHETDPGMREVACDVVRRADLKELSLVVAEQISDRSPWPMNLVAMRTLLKIDVIPARRTLSAYADACSTRLADTELQLRSLDSVGEAISLRFEQIGLLQNLDAQRRRSWYIRLRFGFGMIATELGEAPTIEGGPDEWLDLVEHGSTEEAALAAHHLLAQGRASEILDRIGDPPRNDRLLIAAAAFSVGDLDWVENFTLRMLHHVHPSELEGPAAVLASVFWIDRMRGIKLALRAGRIVRDRDIAERRFWPWSVALGICHGRPEEHEALLNEGEVELAIDALSSYGFLLNGEERPDHVFGETAKEKLLHAVTDENLVDWAHAAATVGLTEAVPVIREHIAGGRSEPVLQKALEYLTSDQ